MSASFSTEYLFTNRYNNGVYDASFEGYTRLPFIGELDLLTEEMQRKSKFRRVLDAILGKVNFGKFLGQVISLDLSGVKKFLEEKDNEKTLDSFLHDRISKTKSSGTYYKRIAYPDFEGPKIYPTKTVPEGKLITVEGALIHRSVVSQYFAELDQQLKKSTDVGEWFLADFPPQGFVVKNEHFGGRVLLLKEDAIFKSVFGGDLLPFSKKFGYYPYLRVTGFFSAVNNQQHGFDVLRPALIEYRQPKIWTDQRKPFIGFLSTELNSPTFLRQTQDWAHFAYLAPILFERSSVSVSLIDADLAALLKLFRDKVGDDLPESVRWFYYPETT